MISHIKSLAAWACRDYALVLGTVLLYSALLITLNLAADFVLSALDPRIRRNL